LPINPTKYKGGDKMNSVEFLIRLIDLANLVIELTKLIISKIN